MLASYLKSAYRQFLGQKLYTSLNIFGLAVGLACCLLIGVLALHEWSYDRFHQDADRIVRLTNISDTQTGISTSASVQLPVGNLIRDDFPHLTVARIWRDFAPFHQSEFPTIRVDEVQDLETGFLYADSTFLDVFSFPVLRGDAPTALRTPYEVLLTESAARKYFGDADPLGESITMVDSGTPFTVGGILADPPPNSHLKFDFVASFATLEAAWTERFGRPSIVSSIWTWNNTWVYARSAESLDLASLNAGLADFVGRNLPPEMQESQRYSFQRLLDIHFTPGLEAEFEEAGSRRRLVLFVVIAAFILVIGGINFTNLALARSVRRIREMGVRKAVGAANRQLVAQLVVENVLQTIVAAALSLVICMELLPFFGVLVGKGFDTQSILQGPLMGGFLVAVVFLGLISGVIPAWMYTQNRAAAALRGQEGSGAGRGVRLFRASLVVAQFTVTIGLMMCAGVVFRQVDYLKGKDLGYSADQLVVVETSALRDMNRYTAFVNELGEYGRISGTTTTESIPGRFVYDYYLRPEGTAEDEVVSIPYLWTDSEFFDVFDVEFVTGREETRNAAGISYVLNESAVRSLGWDDPIGKRIYREQGGRIAWEGVVTGIVRDFHFRPLRQPIDPLIVAVRPNPRIQGMDQDVRFNLGVSLVRIEPGDVPGTLAYIEEAWKRHAPADRPFNATFLDENLAQLYGPEERIQDLLSVLALIAIVIACFGLLGLAAHAAERRTKEVGIRKVLGATIPGIVGLLSREFVVQVAMAFVIALPISIFAMTRWLDSFAFRTQLGWQVFVLSGLMAIAIGAVVVSIHAVRASLSNPVEALRYE